MRFGIGKIGRTKGENCSPRILGAERACALARMLPRVMGDADGCDMPAF